MGMLITFTVVVSHENYEDVPVKQQSVSGARLCIRRLQQRSSECACLHILEGQDLDDVRGQM